MINNFLRILFPQSCPVCKNYSKDHKTAPICRDCWQTISPYRGAICQRCGRPLSSDVSIICSECIKDKPSFKQVRSFGIYEGTLKVAINLFKYHGIKRLSKPLAKMMCQMSIPPVDVIIPVPLFKKRLRHREFNQSALLARYLADYTGARLVMNCLIKVKDTIPQVGLSAKERKKNVKNAFRVLDDKPIKGRDVILVDDVFTTGATIRECSKILKKAGAGDIYGITLAHSRGEL